ncbi:hypothetical protein [Corynebacterium sp. AOP12-C2-36]|uniref:hypothetical protein n=1 Tax=Corynebacterium sp. AOP12-C2-36 TaxID=3457723 RepID=UPI004033B44C
MEQIDVAVAAISGGAAIIGALIGAWWGGWLAARSAKRTQMRSIYIEEWKQISPAKLLVKKVAFFRPRDAKTMVEHMRKLADDVSMLGSRCYVKEMRDDFDLLYYLIHDMAAFVANEPMAVFKPKGDPAEDTVFVATEKEIERIEDIYRSLIETGKMPPRRGDGLYVLPTRPRVHKVRR